MQTSLKFLNFLLVWNRKFSFWAFTKNKAVLFSLMLILMTMVVVVMKSCSGCKTDQRGSIQHCFTPTLNPTTTIPPPPIHLLIWKLSRSPFPSLPPLLGCALSLRGTHSNRCNTAVEDWAGRLRGPDLSQHLWLDRTGERSGCESSSRFFS